jgi:hypothetical protein
MSQTVLSAFDFTKTIAIGSLCISIASLLLSAINSYFTWQNRKLALRQEQRKAPALACSLIHGFQKSDGSGRAFSVHVLVRNPSDSNNAIANAELVVQYLTTDRMLMTVKLETDERATKKFLRGQGDPIMIPAKIPAHETISGWLHFFAPEELLKGISIDSYSLVLTDTHEEKTSVAPNLMQEYRDEV